MTRKEFYKNLFDKGVKDPTVAKQYEQRWLDSGRAFEEAPQVPEPQPKPGKGVLKTAVDDLSGKLEQRNANIYSPTSLGQMLNLKNGSLAEGVVGAPERVLRLGLNAIGGAGDVVATPFIAGFDAVNRVTGGTLGGLAKKGIQKTGLPKVATSVENWKSNLPTSDQANVNSFISGIEGLAQLAGVKTAPKVAGMVKKPVVKEAVKPLQNETGALKYESGGSIPDVDELEKVEEALKAQGESSGRLTAKQIKKQTSEGQKPPLLSGLDERETNILALPKSESARPYTDFALQAKKSLKVLDQEGNPIPDSYQMVANRLGTEQKKIKEIRQGIGEKKGNYLQTIDDAVINNGDFIQGGDLKKTWSEMLPEIMGAYIDDAGKLREAANGFTAEKLLPQAKQITHMIMRQSDEMTAKQADNLSGNLREFLQDYKDSKFNKHGNRVDLLVNNLRSKIDNMIEEKAKTLLDQTAFDNYKQAKTNYARISRIEDGLSSMLGKEVIPGTDMGSRAASIVKRAVQSNANAESAAMFKAIKQLTGYDALQEAHYADIAMKAAGHPKSFNLLETTAGMGKDAYTGKYGNVVKGAAKGAAGVVQGNKFDKLINYYNKMQSKNKIGSK